MIINVTLAIDVNITAWRMAYLSDDPAAFVREYVAHLVENECIEVNSVTIVSDVPAYRCVCCGRPYSDPTARECGCTLGAVTE